MKRVLLILTCVLTNMVMMSCTSDLVETTPNNNKVSAVDNGSGLPLPTKPPK
jgi:hypothetical protein